MSEVLTFGHKHQGHKFDVHLVQILSGFTYFVAIHFPGAESLQTNSGRDIYNDADSAHQTARLRAWAIIDGFVMASMS